MRHKNKKDNSLFTIICSLYYGRSLSRKENVCLSKFVLDNNLDNVPSDKNILDQFEQVDANIEKQWARVWSQIKQSPDAKAPDPFPIRFWQPNRSVIPRKYRPIVIAAAILVISGLIVFNYFLPGPADNPQEQTKVMEASTLFSDERSAINAVAGIYAKMQGTPSFFNGYLSRYLGLYSDELTRTSISAPDVFFGNNNLQPSDAIISDFWNSGYFYVYCANQAMEKLGASPSIRTDRKNILLGELKFLRAFVNFYLVNLYGDIPLVLTANADSSSMLKRAPQKEVYRQIVKDLKDAYTLLPETYPTIYNVPSDRVRPNRAVAAALLAKVFLFNRNFHSAEKYSSWVINSGIYRLETNLENTFLATSKELIFGLHPTIPPCNTLEARLFLASPSRPGFSLTNHVIQKFFPNDLRLKKWIKPVNTSNGLVYVPYKYKVFESNMAIEYTVLLRLSELYLIRAEANWNMGKYSLAAEDINVLRSRAQTDLLSINPVPDQLRQTIEDEYLRELFAENGSRWFQLKRLPGIANAQKSRADEVLTAIKPGKWESDKIYLPVPTEEILKSLNITQKRGYKN